MISPIEFLREAIKAVPAVKYALGVGGIVATVAIIKTFKLDIGVAFVSVLVMLILMGVLVVFARMSTLSGAKLRLPALVLTWFVLLMFIIASGSLLSSVFFQRPLDLSEWIKPQPSKPVTADTQISLFSDSDWVGGGSSIDPYCNDQKAAYAMQYPGRMIVTVNKKEDHKSEFTPFKHDYYRYQCWFTVK